MHDEIAKIRALSIFPEKERVKKSRDATTLRHSRESGNPEAAVRYTGPFLLRKRRKQIPAFAGMTKYYSMGIVFYGADTSAIRPSR